MWVGAWTLCPKVSLTRVSPKGERKTSTRLDAHKGSADICTHVYVISMDDVMSFVCGWECLHRVGRADEARMAAHTLALVQ